MTFIRLLSSLVTRNRAARRVLVLLAAGCAAGGVAHPQHALAQRNPKSETLQPPRFFMLRGAGSRPIRVDVAAVPVLQRRVRLDLDGVSRKAALAEIARQSGLRLFYVDNVIDATAPVQLRASAITVAGALGAVLSGIAIDVILAPDGSATLVRQGRTQSLSQAGTIVGEVIDAATHAPVEDVRVEVVGTSVTTRTNADGVFRLLSVPAGVVALRTHAVGFAPLVRTDVAVSTAKPVQVTLALHWIAVALEQVTVRPNYFEIAFDAPTSTHRLNAEEIRRAPGAQEDVVRAIASSARRCHTFAAK